MAVFVGCDVGTVAVKAALITDEPERVGRATWEDRREPSRVRLSHEGWSAFVIPSRRLRSDPVLSTVELLAEIPQTVRREVSGLCVTGAGSRDLAERIGGARENELRALAWGIGLTHPDVDQVFEMGGGKACFLALDTSASGMEVGVLDYELSGECAAGTGSFIDQQATRLRFPIEEVGGIALAASRAARIAGRCAVFAKTDMIHAQQTGRTPEEILRGLCEAVAHTFEAAVLRGRRPGSRVAFVGGVAQNEAVLVALRRILDLDGQLFAPPFPAHYGALGAALLARWRDSETPLLSISRSPPRRPEPLLGETSEAIREPPVPAASWNRRRPSEISSTRAPLNPSRVTFLRDRVVAPRLPVSGRTEGHLGLDVGSVSTNLVAIDSEGKVLSEIYLRTEGRPVEAVGKALHQVERLVDDRFVVRSVGTTGSGRELSGEVVGADAIHDEITAHKTGALWVARHYLGREVDTIFEIGGQDAKYIHLSRGVVVDFAMNEACAAGTGSFLEEQAEKLGVRIEEEFARQALASEAPLSLGERCTVFMERDLSHWQQEGAELRDMLAGLAYAVVENYLNRVVRGRPVGETIFFQGGTAYNDAVAAAFAQVLGKPIVVPPHNGVLGAYGAALLAREKFLALGGPTGFRGYDLGLVRRDVRVFTCGGCTNHCDVQEISVEGRKTYWGDKCSERFRREAKTDSHPSTPDLIGLREQLLHTDYLARFSQEWGPAGDAARSLEARGNVPRRTEVGVPLTLHALELLPFWTTYLRGLGLEPRLSKPTTKEAVDLGGGISVSEPCFPIQVALGHAASLLAAGQEFLFVPNLLTASAADTGGTHAFFCPWTQTFPYVFAASPLAHTCEERLLVPVLRLQDGQNAAEAALWVVFRRFGIHRAQHRVAVRLAFHAQKTFRAALHEAGLQALDALRASGRSGLVLVGRPYNLYDGGLNLNLPRKLRALYGVDLLPLDFLPLEGVEITDLAPNMYWNHGRRILQAARLSSAHPNLHLLYLTNFKCGPDSYVKPFSEDAAEKPFLAIQLDGHANDAGILTRCEAYLDSIGALRWWTQATRSTEALSSCPECAMTEPPSSSQLFVA